MRTTLFSEVFALDGVVDKFLGGSNLLVFDVLTFVGAVDGAGIGRDCIHLLLLVDGDVEETGAHGFTRHYEDHVVQHREVYLHGRTHENLLHQVSCLVKHHLVCLLQSEVVGLCVAKSTSLGIKTVLCSVISCNTTFTVKLRRLSSFVYASRINS